MSSSDSEYDLVAYGTPLEPLEEDEIPTKKPRLLEDQIVTDKQGRRRFHGAFTGGFSAGFFNTVGSLEGWTPSSFKSTKTKKQEAFLQKPEDFMDEEDQSEFGISPIVLKARQDYTNENKRETSGFSKCPTIGTYILQNLLKPVRETIGIKLLKRMGWKPGQGVGPRLSKKEKENAFKIRQKTYGCQLPPGVSEEKDEDHYSDSEWDNIEFAPNDYEPLLCEARNNFFGLGYEGLDKRPVLSGNLFKKGDKNKKYNFSSQAFGVGAFEEEDEDIYARDDMSRYDFSLGNNKLTNTNKPTDKNSLTSEGVLEGFVPETKKHLRKNYLLPTLPRDFKPHHKIRRSRFDQPSTEDNVKSVKGLNVTSMGLTVGKKLEVFNEEIMEAKKLKEKLTKESISNVKIDENRFKPFPFNPDKQERYENYLKLVKIGQKDRLRDIQPLSMTTWDRERENIEFEKAAMLFKPLSGGMEERFLSAGQPDDLSDPLAVVERVVIDLLRPHKQKYVDEKDDRKKAAKMNMFGPLTRKTEDWVPCSLLCKRFNIPEPKKGQVQPNEKKITKTYFNIFDAIQDLKQNKKQTENMEKPEEDSKEEKANRNEPEIIELKEENSIKEIQDKTDLFKAIFLASDDDKDESDEEKTEKTKGEQFPNSLVTAESVQDDLLYEEKLINSKRNLSPPSGLFKNLDLDLLSRAKKIPEEIPKNKTVKSVVETAESNSLSCNLVYGPKLPNKVPAKVGFFTSEHSDDDGVWVERKSHGEKRHKKKVKKHKKALRKSKHKHKKHKK